MQIIIIISLAVLAFMAGIVLVAKPKCRFCVFYHKGFCAEKKRRVSPLGICDCFQ